MMASVNSLGENSLPTPARTSTEAIVSAARQLLEREGIEAVTMQAVAGLVGVRPPSLYKRIRGHADLMHRVANDVGTELADELDAAYAEAAPGSELEAVATAFRAWASASPAAYGLLTAPLPDSWRADDDVNARVSAAIRDGVKQLVGEERALEAARTFVAFAHGFVSLELAGGFRLGGDPSDAYRYGVKTLIKAMSAPE